MLITSVTPSAASASISASTSRLALRVEAGGRLVEQQHVGLQRPGARQRQALLLAARQRARRTRRPAPSRPTRCSARAAALRRAARAARRAATSPSSTLPAHRQAQQERPLEQHRLTPARGRAIASTRAARRTAPGRAAGAAAWSCPIRWRRPAPARSPRRSVEARRRAAPARRRSARRRCCSSDQRLRASSALPMRRPARAPPILHAGSGIGLALARRAALHRAITRLITPTTPSSTTPSASASGRSPLLVSSAIAVVITRVKPSMLPPTIITAPTSDDRAAERGEQHREHAEALVQQHQQRALERPRAERAQLVAACRCRPSSTRRRDSAAISGSTRMLCAITIAVGVNRMPTSPAARSATAAGRRPGRPPPTAAPAAC